MNGATPSPVRVKTLLIAFGVVVALAAFLGMLLGAAGSTGSDGGVREVSSDSQYYEGDSESQYSEGGSSDSQFYESGSIVRGDDGEYIYSDDNGNSVSFGG